MYRSCFIFPGILLVLGCSGPELAYTDHSRDPELLAQNIKQLVVAEVADARKSRDPADHLRALHISLPEPGSKKPVGNYAGVYERMGQFTEQLIEATERAGGPTPDLRQKLDQLLAMADELPGDVSASTEPGR